MTSKVYNYVKYGVGYLVDITGASMQFSSLVFLSGKVVDCYQTQNAFCNDVRTADMEYEKMSASLNTNKVIIAIGMFGLGLAIRKTGQYVMYHSNRTWRRLPF